MSRTQEKAHFSPGLSFFQKLPSYVGTDHTCVSKSMSGVGTSGLEPLISIFWERNKSTKSSTPCLVLLHLLPIISSFSPCSSGRGVGDGGQKKHHAGVRMSKSCLLCDLLSSSRVQPGLTQHQYSQALEEGKEKLKETRASGRNMLLVYPG